MASMIRGPWYFLFTVYFYALLAVGFFLIIKKVKNSDPIYNKQNYIIIIAAIIPWLANIAYLVGLRPFGYVDATPFAFIITTFFIFIGIYRFKLFDIIPIARQKVLELMQDGFFVLDHQNRIIDYNNSIKKYIKKEDNRSLIGLEIRNVIPNQPILFEHVTSYPRKSRAESQFKR